MKRSMARLFCVLLMLVLTPARGFGADSWDHWQGHDETSMKSVNHGLWEGILLNYIRPGTDGVHRFAYGQVTDTDQKALDKYLKTLSKVTITDYRNSEQMAYWINLHNALTVNLILAHYPIASIRKLRDRTADHQQTPWDQKLITVEGRQLSLNDIEKRILKPIWQDQRIQYALSCGAVGCPNLQPVPYSGDDLERQLSDVAIAYVNDERCMTIEDGELRVSSLYRWNIQDFGGSDQGIIHHLMAYAAPELAMSLQEFDRIQGDRFDWRLNDIE